MDFFCINKIICYVNKCKYNNKSAKAANIPNNICHNLHSYIIDEDSKWYVVTCQYLLQLFHEF